MDRDPRRRQPDLVLAPRQLENLWDDLAGEDAARAWRAVCTLVQAPEQAIPWLKEHLKTPGAGDRNRITHLIADLDSDQFAARQQAARELEKLAELAETPMREALEKHPSLEVRRQLERLLERLEGPAQTPRVMRELRSLEVLEHTGTHEARQVLEALARGAPKDRLTREAKAALQRLATQSVPKP
jgi:hypothetical protein